MDVLKEQKNSTAVGAARTLRGVVVSNAMKDTVVVKVTRFVKEPRYGKYRKVARRIQAHDLGNTKAVGDTVAMQSCRPLSKKKHHTVVQN